MLRPFIYLIFSLFLITPCLQAKRYRHLELVADEIKVDDKRCYPVRIMQDYGEKKHEWTLFCGEFTNVYIVHGYAYPLLVEDYYSGIDTIHVIKVRNCFERHYWEDYNKRLWSECQEWIRKQNFTPSL